MAIDGTTALDSLERWSPTAFIASGVGFLIALALLLVDGTTAVTVSELTISVVTVPSMLVLSIVALPGFYPYVADASPRLALGGVVAAALAGVTITLMIVGSIVLDLLGIVGFTEEGPLIAGFFLWMLAFFLSMLCYGLASARTGTPSRVVGILLLVVIVEPGASLLNDVVGLDLGIVVLYATLAVAGGAFLGIGYLLRSEYAPRGTAESAAETTA